MDDIIIKEYHKRLQYLSSLISSKPVEFTSKAEDLTVRTNHISDKIRKAVALDGLKDCGGLVGINRILDYLEILNNPHKELKVIHISGTSGKGSTAFMLQNILLQTGYSVGMHISPHLITPLERIWINGKVIPVQDFISLVDQLRSALDEHLETMEYGMVSYFEFLVCAAFLYFKQQKLDVCIIEVGMGGTLDGTNVIDNPLCSIITNIGYDHMDRLGHTREEITKNKAGIIKPDSIVINGVLDKPLNIIIQEKCHQNNSIIYQWKQDFDIQIQKIDKQGSIFDYQSPDLSLNAIALSSLGEFQIHNAALSIACLRALTRRGKIQVNQQDYYNGLGSVNIPARCEIFNYQGREILIDGAHNPDKIQTIIHFIQQAYNHKKIYFIIGFTKGKLLDDIPNIIQPIANKIIITRPLVSERQIENPLLIKDYFNQNNCAIPIKILTDPYHAFDYALDDSKEDTLIVITGSLYLAGNIRSLFINENDILNSQTLF